MPNVISRKTLTANRKNAARSTGPTSPEGKDRVSQNAIRHGFFAQRAVLTGGDFPESQKEFNALLERFYADFQPVSAFECACVERMVSACWRMRRAYQFEVATLIDEGGGYDTQSPSDFLPEKNDSDKLVRYESMLDRQFFRAHQRLMGARLAMQKAATVLADDHAIPDSPAPDAPASTSHDVTLPQQEEIADSTEDRSPITGG